MKKAKKEFDAVLMMREIRDRLSGQIEGMSFEEEKRFIRKHVPQPKARPTILRCSRQAAHSGEPSSKEFARAAAAERQAVSAPSAAWRFLAGCESLRSKD